MGIRGGGPLGDTQPKFLKDPGCSLSLAVVSDGVVLELLVLLECRTMMMEYINKMILYCNHCTES